jgi:NAD(P)H-flavin reductase
MAAPMTPEPYRVVRRRKETAHTWTLTLERLTGGSPKVLPGQFMMVYSFGVGEVPISVSGPGGRPGPLAHTVRAVGPVTSAICAARAGAVLGLRGPYGNVWPLDDAGGADIVVVAGGIGLAPLRPALLSVLERRTEFGNLFLLYGARTPADLLYRRELARWGTSRSLDADVTVDLAERGWPGKVGVVPKLVAGAGFDPESTVALVCGPEIMMRYAAEALAERGVPTERIFLSFERNMQCGLGHCGHCQLGPTLICRDGPVYPYEQVATLMEVREL